jgi:hypothetical protein
MRVNAGFSRLLRLDGIWVRGVRFDLDRVAVTVALRRRRLCCPLCAYSTPHRHNRQQVESVWRHLDLGVWRLELRARLRRVVCPEHGVRVEAVPFARYGARFTRDFEALVAWLATRTDQTTMFEIGIDDRAPEGPRSRARTPGSSGSRRGSRGSGARSRRLQKMVDAAVGHAELRRAVANLDSGQRAELLDGLLEELGGVRGELPQRVTDELLGGRCVASAARLRSWFRPGCSAS